MITQTGQVGQDEVSEDQYSAEESMNIGNMFSEEEQPEPKIDKIERIEPRKITKEVEAPI